MAGQPGPPRDPRSQSERRRRVSIQTPPNPDEIPLGQIPVPFEGRQLSSRSISAEPKAPSADYPRSCNHDRTHINRVDLPTTVGYEGVVLPSAVAIHSG